MTHLGFFLTSVVRNAEKPNLPFFWGYLLASNYADS